MKYIIDINVFHNPATPVNVSLEKVVSLHKWNTVLKY